LSKNPKPRRTVKSPDRRPNALRVVQGMFDDALRHHQAGRIDNAVARYRRALLLNPDYAEAHNNLGVALVAQARIVEAMTHYERALALKPDYADAHNNLGNALAAQGRIHDAVAHYERALILSPDHANAHCNLGISLAAQGRVDDAVAHYQRALALDPDHVNTHNNLGVALAAQGRIDEAVAHYERALVLNPDYTDAHNNLGNALVAQDRIDEAVAHYQRALTLKPDYADAHNNLGNALVAQGRIGEAVAHYERALALKPDYADAHNNLGSTLVAQGRIDDGVAHYKHALVLNPDHVNAHCNLGISLAAQGNLGDAMAHYERALAIDPDHAEAHNNLGNIFTDQGKFDDAMAHYGRAIAIRPAYAEAHFNRAEIKTFRQGDADLAALEALANRDDLSANKAMNIHFALAKALEDIGDSARAFVHLRKGNDLKRRQTNYDELAVVKFFKRISTVFDSSLFDRFQGEGDPSSVPIFVLGMPRSGSTLIEQILASHPQIYGAGELTDLEMAVSTVLSSSDKPVQFPEFVPVLDGVTLRQIGRSYLARLPALPDGKVRIVDKLPGNFIRIGLIRLILPNARIIHTMRHPIDTCVSCYSKLFTSGHDFCYDLAELGRHYRCYRELMTHWRSVLPPSAILDVSYEDVVDDLEGQARRLIDYCALPWDDRCISFHRTSRPVKTASAVQVRKPLFRSSLQRWLKYEAGLGPLLHELGDIIPDRVPAPAGGTTNATSSK
jgi:tetratricopeptide (TPR) repeat protein